MKNRNAYDPKAGVQGEKEGEDALLMNKKRGSFLRDTVL